MSQGSSVIWSDRGRTNPCPFPPLFFFFFFWGGGDGRHRRHRRPQRPGSHVAANNVSLRTLKCKGAKTQIEWMNPDCVTNMGETKPPSDVGLFRLFHRVNDNLRPGGGLQQDKSRHHVGNHARAHVPARRLDRIRDRWRSVRAQVAVNF